MNKIERKTRGRDKKSYTTDRRQFKMAIISPSLPIITLKINGLNSPVKRYRVTE